MRNLIIRASVLVLSLFVFICCSDKKSEMEDAFLASEVFFEKFQTLKKVAYSEDVLSTTQTRAEMNNNDAVLVEVVLPVDEQDVDFSVPEICLASNLNDLQTIAMNYAASFNIVEDSDNPDRTISLSESKVKTALSPMVRQSKDFLNSIGMSDLDISNMLSEEGVDETLLIPFALALMEHDQQVYYSWSYGNSLSIIPQANAINMSDVGHCALAAIGADIFYGLSTSMCKTWSKVLIKKAFKAAATRMIGPVGVAITIVSFGLCLEGIEI